MKMHPKPMLRHTKNVEPFECVAETTFINAYALSLEFTRLSDGATQRAMFTKEEAIQFLRRVASVVHYGDLPASEISTEEFADFNWTLQKIIDPPECNHDWEDGYSMNGSTKTCRKCGKFIRD